MTPYAWGGFWAGIVFMATGHLWLMIAAWACAGMDVLVTRA